MLRSPSEDQLTEALLTNYSSPTLVSPTLALSNVDLTALIDDVTICSSHQRFFSDACLSNASPLQYWPHRLIDDVTICSSLRYAHSH